MDRPESLSKRRARKIKETAVPGQPVILHPTVAQSGSVTEEDVWGHMNENHTRRLDNGMIVARYGMTCPIFGDEVPYKAVTAVCDKSQLHDVIYWLEYVHGGGSVTEVKDLPDGKVAIRSHYQAD